jgi:hypothetical protein
MLGLLLLGCSWATPYQPKGLSGGYSEDQLSENTFRVSFLGNAAVSSVQASDFALLRASELALEHGYTYLVITDIASGRAMKDSELSPVQSTQTHGQVQTSVAITPVMTFEYPNASYTVVFYKEDPPTASGLVGARPMDRVVVDSWTVSPGEVINARSLRDSLRRKYEMKANTQ